MLTDSAAGKPNESVDDVADPRLSSQRVRVTCQHIIAEHIGKDAARLTSTVQDRRTGR